MKWKVGDKVRLTGWAWPTHGTFSRGSEHTIVSVRGTDQVLFENDSMTGYWVILPRWEIELVERKEETMTVNFSEVNVGDKVRLTRENGDESTFTVKNKSRGFISSDSQNFSTKLWDTLEILERAFKPVPGLYTDVNSQDRVVLLENGKVYYTAATGAWIESNHENRHRPGYKAVQEQDGWRREITF